jgi:hypothetical protein
MGFLRIVIFFFFLLPAAAFSAEPGATRLSLIRGDVQIYTPDAQDWVPAAINMPLREGDRIWVPEGARTEVQIQGGVYIRLGSATSFDILTLQEESFQFFLNGGHAYINNRRGGIDHIQVDTPQSSVGCYDNSLVMIDVAESGATDVSVIKGYTLAETQSGSTRVEAGNTLRLGSDMTAELFPLPPPDDWEDWNRDRDRRLLAGNRSLRYLPEALDDYAYELDNNGKWVYVTDYGYCWTPLNVPAGWAPYRDGRWVWFGGDYVWVSYEPWGWAPHHYGRWTFVVNFGWCWVPPAAGEVYWAPGYVGWVNTPTYVAWVPLAPGDIFYGRGYYGPRSVNITNVTINQTVIQNFRNVSVRNAVTVINRTTFAGGRKEPVRVAGNPFRAANVSAGPPVVKRTRETAMPVIRNIPPAKRPPERVRRVSVEQMRQERKVVRGEKGSVFRPQQPTREMPVRKREEPQRVLRDEHPPIPTTKPSQQRRQFTPRGEQPPPARAPETARERPAPKSAQPTPGRERIQPSSPGQAPPETRSEPRREIPRKTPREPRWQEPTPAGHPEAPRQSAPQASQGAPERQGAPAAKPNAQHREAPQPPARQAAPQAGETNHPPQKPAERPEQSRAKGERKPKEEQ